MTARCPTNRNSLPQPLWNAQVQCYWGVSPAQASLISSAAFIGQFFGFLLAGSLSDVLGRHRVLLGTAVQLLAFSALSGLAPSYRVSGGAAGRVFGAAGSVSPCMRGRLLACCTNIAVPMAMLAAVPVARQWLVACRILVGLSMGSMPVVETLAVEFLPAANRGRYLLLVHCFWVSQLRHAASCTGHATHAGHAVCVGGLA